VNKSELARDVGISATTAGEWLSALEASNQIVLLEPFFANFGKRLVKTPKLYFRDTGLLCFLLGVTHEAIGTSPLTGALWENLVFTELATWIEYFRPEWTLWFYRDQRQHEADFLIQGPWNRVRVLDAKWTEDPPRKAFAGADLVGQLVARAPDITEVETGVIARAARNHRLGDDRVLISAFDVAGYLETDRAL